MSEFEATSIASIILHEEFKLLHREIPRDTLFVPSWGIHVVQVSPIECDYEAIVTFDKKYHPEIMSIIMEYDDRTRSFFMEIDQETHSFTKLSENHIKIYTDLKYNPYLSYYHCFCKLCPFLHDTVFFIVQDEEEDEGQSRYIADQYRIQNGALYFERIYSGYGVNQTIPNQDYETFISNLYDHYNDST